MRAIARLVAAALLFPVLACQRTPEAPPSQPNRPSAQALARLAIIQRFRPPVDGLLTDAMIDRYARYHAASKNHPEADAARLLAFDADELTWVRARILEALAALDTRKVRAASEESYARAIASLKRTRDSARDRETVKSLTEQIAALEKERSSLKTLESMPASIQANARRVAARRAEVEAAIQ
jgi:hypothetical protein